MTLDSGTRTVRRVLLVEANNMTKWVGSTIPYEVHIPPLGLMCVAAYARQARPQIEFRIVESSLPHLSEQGLTDLLEEFQPDVVGIRSIAFFLEEMQRIAAGVRAWGDPILVAGGPIVQAYQPRLFEEVPELDLAVKGEGEQVFSDLLGGADPLQLPGVLCRVNGRVTENPDAPEIKDIDGLPFPAYDLIDLDLYQRQLSYSYNHRRQGILMTSRGCAYHCTYCFTHWKSLRLRSAASVFWEIEHLYLRHQIRDFYVVDDIFNVNVKRALDIFGRIRAAGLQLRLYFVNGLRADLATHEFVDSAVAAGAIWFTYAVESGAEEIQRFVRKNLNLDKTREIIAYTQRQNVVVNISTMFGFPSETPAQAQRTLDYLGELPKPSLLPYHFCLRFFPGCEINQQAIDCGWAPEQLEATSRFSYNDLPMGTPTLPRAEMYRVLLQYHDRFGMTNPSALDGSVRTLEAVGYSEEEILHMYSVLKRKIIHQTGELKLAAQA
jgi:anaerobic magnesium-protoporphyrin IX monomethyl ester cyclase